VCSGEELPEVEIISLLEEQIPRYRLRADTLTQFQGKSFVFFSPLLKKKKKKKKKRKEKHKM
jgi:trafficking kinesin-binding protein 1